jgi:multidrug efflux pump subunit AcrA (membrane-fusion protein)
MKTTPYFFIILLALSCKSSNEKIHPVIESISESVYASGIIKSRNQYQVYSSVNGLIQEIYVSEGDTVQQGDPLIKVLNESSQLNTFNAKLAADNANIYANTDKLSESKVTMGFALSKMKSDSLLFVRQSSLWSQGIGSRNDFEQRELTYKNSVANYQVTVLRLHELQRQLVFASKQSNTNLKISNSLANDYIIKAETPGKVYKILKEKGEFANTVNPIAVLGDAREFLIEMKVDEYDIARIRKGQKVLYSMDSYKGKVFEASVLKIEPLMNEQTRSFTVTAVFITKPLALYPNLSVEANVIIRTKGNAMTIPRSCLTGDSAVIMSNGDSRKVVTGLKDYQKVEILSGLTVSDMITSPKP